MAWYSDVLVQHLYMTDLSRLYDDTAEWFYHENIADAFGVVLDCKQ